MGALDVETGGVVVPSCLDDYEEEELDLGSGNGSGSFSDNELGSVEEAVEVLLVGLGEDVSREGIRKTPLRVAKAFRDGTRGYKQNVKNIVHDALFPEAGLDNGKGLAGGSGGLVVVRDISLFSYCESCLLPFKIQCQVGYVPSGQRVVGLSKLARVADVFAKRLQAPEKLADEICFALQSSIKPAGVAVALQCWHIQLPEAFEKISDLKTPSIVDTQGWLQVHACSTSGVFSDKSSCLDEFLSLLQFRGVKMENIVSHNSPIKYPKVSSCNGHGTTDHTNGRIVQPWCPMSSLAIPSCNGYSATDFVNGSLLNKNGCLEPAMLAAVTSIISSIGEDPLRRELIGTPHRFVHWLMHFKKSPFDIKLNGFNYGLHMRANGGDHDDHEELVSELNIPFCAQCEHHLLPFHGVVHVGYLTSKGHLPFERSLLHSIVQHFGCQLQVQERLTRQVAETVFLNYNKGVMVVVEANHICMISRGVEKIGSNTATVATMGQLSTDTSAKAAFLQTIRESTSVGQEFTFLTAAQQQTDWDQDLKNL